jgi:hypothetical protein
VRKWSEGRFYHVTTDARGREDYVDVTAEVWALVQACLDLERYVEIIEGQDDD